MPPRSTTTTSEAAAGFHQVFGVTNPPRLTIAIRKYTSVMESMTIRSVRVRNLPTAFGSGSGGTDQLISIEDVLGSAHTDNITGDDGDNVILGVGGHDFLFGRHGNANATTRNVRVARVDAKRNLLLVHGSVPGHPNAFVRVRAAKSAK